MESLHFSFLTPSSPISFPFFSPTENQALIALGLVRGVSETHNMVFV